MNDVKDPTTSSGGPDAAFTVDDPELENKIRETVGSDGAEVVLDTTGNLYTGLEDGRIVRVPVAGGKPEVVADTGGRPLGMKLDAAGNLVVADALRGLLSVASSKTDGEEEADVGEVVRETVEMLSFRKMFRDVEVVVETGGVGRARISAERFRQVLLNLMINAVDAMEGKGTLRVRTFVVRPWVAPALRKARRRASDPPEVDVLRLRGVAGVRPGGALAVSVSDTGCGIGPKALPSIFDPFFTTKEAGKGTGLGLSVSLAIVEGAGGEIVVESGEGEGSTFTVILPEAVEKAAPGDPNRAGG